MWNSTELILSSLIGLYLTLFLTLKESKYYIMGLSFKAILFPDTYDTLLGNENIQTFLLIATYTSCEYTYGIFLS